MEEVVEGVIAEYRSSLADLHVNSKPHIDMLTIVAKENAHYAKLIASLIEERLYEVKPKEKLLIFYLIDSIVKNVEGDYKKFFNERLVENFKHAFEYADDNTKVKMYNLRETWNGKWFTPQKLKLLDIAVHELDHNWPVKNSGAQELNSKNKIHINPKFFSTKKNPTALKETHEQMEKKLSLEAEIRELERERIRLELDAELERKKIELEKMHKQHKRESRAESNIQQRLASEAKSGDGKSSGKVANKASKATNRSGTSKVEPSSTTRNSVKKSSKLSKAAQASKDVVAKKTFKKTHNQQKDPRLARGNNNSSSRSMNNKRTRAADVSTAAVPVTHETPPPPSSSDSDIADNDARFSPEPETVVLVNGRAPPPRKRPRVTETAIAVADVSKPTMEGVETFMSLHVPDDVTPNQRQEIIKKADAKFRKGKLSNLEHKTILKKLDKAFDKDVSHNTNAVPQDPRKARMNRKESGKSKQSNSSQQNNQTAGGRGNKSGGPKQQQQQQQNSGGELQYPIVPPNRQNRFHPHQQAPPPPPPPHPHMMRKDIKGGNFPVPNAQMNSKSASGKAQQSRNFYDRSHKGQQQHNKDNNDKAARKRKADRDSKGGSDDSSKRASSDAYNSYKERPVVEPKQRIMEEPEDYIIASLKEEEKLEQLAKEAQANAEEKAVESKKAYEDHMKKLKKSSIPKESPTKQQSPPVQQQQVEDKQQTSAVMEITAADNNIKTPPLPFKKRFLVAEDDQKASKVEKQSSPVIHASDNKNSPRRPAPEDCPPPLPPSSNQQAKDNNASAAKKSKVVVEPERPSPVQTEDQNLKKLKEEAVASRSSPVRNEDTDSRQMQQQQQQQQRGGSGGSSSVYIIEDEDLPGKMRSDQQKFGRNNNNGMGGRRRSSREMKNNYPVRRNNYQDESRQGDDGSSRGGGGGQRNENGKMLDNEPQRTSSGGCGGSGIDNLWDTRDTDIRRNNRRPPPVGNRNNKNNNQDKWKSSPPPDNMEPHSRGGGNIARGRIDERRRGNNHLYPDRRYLKNRNQRYRGNFPYDQEGPGDDQQQQRRGGSPPHHHHHHPHPNDERNMGPPLSQSSNLPPPPNSSAPPDHFDGPPRNSQRFPPDHPHRRLPPPNMPPPPPGHQDPMMQQPNHPVDLMQHPHGNLRLTGPDIIPNMDNMFRHFDKDVRGLPPPPDGPRGQRMDVGPPLPRRPEMPLHLDLMGHHDGPPPPMHRIDGGNTFLRHPDMSRNRFDLPPRRMQDPLPRHPDLIPPHPSSEPHLPPIPAPPIQFRGGDLPPIPVHLARRHHDVPPPSGRDMPPPGYMLAPPPSKESAPPGGSDHRDPRDDLPPRQRQRDYALLPPSVGADHRGDPIFMRPSDLPPVERDLPPLPPRPNQPPPQLPPTTIAAMAPKPQPVDIQKLMSDLVSKGLIPAANDKKPAVAVVESGEKTTTIASAATSTTFAATSEPNNTSAVAVAVTSAVSSQESSNNATATTDVVMADMTSTTSLSQETIPEKENIDASVQEEFLKLEADLDANIPVITFKGDLKIRHDSLIERLYTGKQCSACGYRFTARQNDLYAMHLDWHYRLNRKGKDSSVKVHRDFYPSATDWIQWEKVEDPNKLLQQEAEGEQDNVEEPNSCVSLTGRNGEDICLVCKEAFQTFYNDDDEEWQFANCMSFGEDNFHPSCYEDHCQTKAQITPMKEPMFNLFNSDSNTPIPCLGIDKEEEEANDDKEEKKEEEEANDDEEEKKEEEEHEPLPADSDAESGDEKVESDDEKQQVESQPPSQEEAPRKEEDEQKEEKDDSTANDEQVENTEDDLPQKNDDDDAQEEASGSEESTSTPTTD